MNQFLLGAVSVLGLGLGAIVGYGLIQPGGIDFTADSTPSPSMKKFNEWVREQSVVKQAKEVLKTSSLIIALSLFAGINLPQAADRVEVFKSPYCGCCEKWVEHMRKGGFDMVTKDVSDVQAARKAAGMPERFGSCHTAKVGGYVLEGHVPAADVQRLLEEKPKAVGLSAPGMPQGSPGMETNHPQAYDTLLVQADGSGKVFAKH